MTKRMKAKKFYYFKSLFGDYDTDAGGLSEEILRFFFYVDHFLREACQLQRCVALTLGCRSEIWGQTDFFVLLLFPSTLHFSSHTFSAQDPEFSTFY